MWCIPLPDVGAVEEFEFVVDRGNIDGNVGFDDDPIIYLPQLEDFEFTMDRVVRWRNSNDHADGSYAEVVPESLEEAWNGDAKTPKAPVSSLPARPAIRVSRP